MARHRFREQRSAVPEPTALLLLLKHHLDRSLTTYSATCHSNPHALVPSHNTDISKITPHNLSSFSQPWWRQYSAHEEHSHQPQATPKPTQTSTSPTTYLTRSITAAAVPDITPRSSRRHIPLLKRASLYPLAREADVSGLPLGCTIGHTPSYPSHHLRPGGRDQPTHHLPTHRRPPSRTRQSQSSSSISFYSTITTTNTNQPHPVLHLYSCACARHRDNRLLRPPSQAQALLCVPARGSYHICTQQCLQHPRPEARARFQRLRQPRRPRHAA